jgi:tetratricopeptide (TPR) repeat protein
MGFNEQRRWREARIAFNKAIKRAAETPDAGFLYMAYEGDAESLMAMHRTDEARGRLEAALRVARQHEKRGHQAQCLILLGKLALRDHDQRQGLRDFTAAADLARSIDFYRMTADAMVAAAGIYRQQGNLQGAADCLREGLEAGRRTGDRYYLPRNLTALADLRARQGQVRAADALYGEAEDDIEELLNGMPGSNSRTELVGAMSATYRHHFELMARLGMVERCLEILERARGRTEADLIQDPGALRIPDPPGATALQQVIAVLHNRLFGPGAPNERRKLVESLEVEEQKLAYLLDGLEKPSRKVDNKRVTLAEVQQTLRPDNLLLEYMLGDTRSYCLAISKRRAAVKAIPASKDRIDQMVEDYLEIVGERRKVSPEIESKLYDLLIEPMTGRVKWWRLIVVPDGMLRRLPFDSLRDGSGARLVESFTVTVAPSATVLSVLRNAPRNSEATRRLWRWAG